MSNLNITADLPTTCPACGAELVWKGVDLVCPNDECSAKVYNRLYRFISVVGCNGVKNVGPAMIDDMIQIITKDASESATLTEYVGEAISKMNSILKTTYIEDNYGKATAQKYRSVFENICSNPVNKDLFLLGMNITGLGWKTCQTIAQFNLFTMILHNDPQWIDECWSIKGLGQSVVNSISNNLEYIQYMSNQVLFTESTDSDILEALYPKKYVTVTGSLSVSRSTFDTLIQAYGWAVDSNIKNSEYLVTNNPDPTSSKGKKAKELGKKIITESEFYRVIGMIKAPNVVEVGDVL